MTELVFVDTNILVYARDTRDPRKRQRALDWLERLWRDQCGRTSTQVLNEYYVTVTRKLPPCLAADAAWDDVEALGAWQPQVTNLELMRRARSVAAAMPLSWWDALVVAAAQLQGCAVLLSEDLGHRTRYGGVRVHNPFIDEVQDSEVEEYWSAAVPARHPARGRPRRQSMLDAID